MLPVSFFFLSFFFVVCFQVCGSWCTYDDLFLTSSLQPRESWGKLPGALFIARADGWNAFVNVFEKQFLRWLWRPFHEIPTDSTWKCSCATIYLKVFCEIRYMGDCGWYLGAQEVLGIFVFYCRRFFLVYRCILYFFGRAGHLTPSLSLARRWTVIHPHSVSFLSFSVAVNTG